MVYRFLCSEHCPGKSHEICLNFTVNLTHELKATDALGVHLFILIGINDVKIAEDVLSGW